MRKIIAIGTISLLIFLVGLFTFLGSRGRDLDRESRAYASQSLRAVCGTWEEQSLLERCSTEMKALATKNNQISQWFVQYRKLGKLKEIKEIDGEAHVRLSPGQSRTTASYSAQATFENGMAELRISLIKDDEWTIHGFSVASPVLEGD